MKPASRHAIAILILMAPHLAAHASQLTLTVRVGPADCANVPVHAQVDLPPDVARLPLDQIGVEVRLAGDPAAPAPGQIVRAADGKSHLWWILPAGRAGAAQTWTAKLTPRPAPREDAFAWRDTPGKHLDLLLAGRRVTRYMYEFDESDKGRRFKTAKPFHHVFDAKGHEAITSPGGQPYPHHRGIFIGWSKLTFEGKKYDLWHVRNVEQVHEDFVEMIAGPVLARATARIVWRDPEDQPLLVEERSTTVFRQPAPTLMLMQFHTRLQPARGAVLLAGDPEHAGMQYRPHPEVAALNKTIAAEAKAARKRGEKPAPNPDRTIYRFHKDGINPAREIRRNGKWVPLSKRADKDLPWVAMSYTLRGQRYTVQHMNHPSNPSPSVYSAYRDYGRFGAFFTKGLEAGEVLELAYGIAVLEGRMPPREDLAMRWAAFASPTQVSAK